VSDRKKSVVRDALKNIDLKRVKFGDQNAPGQQSNLALVASRYFCVCLLVAADEVHFSELFARCRAQFTEREIVMTGTAAQKAFTPRFVRKTSLQLGERNTNFLMLDNEIAAAVTSEAADRITPLMSKIYLRLKTVPREFFEREGVLRFAGEEREGKWVTAWVQLREYLRVSSETANKALKWMHEQGIIGYSAFKNGVGIRIFLNRAASSISFRPGSGEQKILRFPHASAGASPTSESETTFKDKNSKNSLDKDNKSGAPKSGAGTSKVIDSTPSLTAQTRQPQTAAQSLSCKAEVVRQDSGDTGSMNEVIERLRREIEPGMRAAATQAAAQVTAREVARTREWFETKALPKAVRVAQRETYNVLRKYGTLDVRQECVCAVLQVGRASVDGREQPATRPLEQKEILELAETCVALLETQGRSVDATLSEISTEGGGWVLPSDTPKVREATGVLLSAGGR